MAAAIGTPGREHRPCRVAIRCASAALLLVLPIVGLVSGLITAGLVAMTWKFSPKRE